MDLLDEYKLESADFEQGELPGQVARTGMLLAEARAELDEISVKLVAWRAVLYEHFAAKDAKAGQWKVNAKIEAKPEWIAQQRELNGAKQTVAELEATLEGLRLRARFELDDGGNEYDAGPVPGYDHKKAARFSRTTVKGADKATKPVKQAKK